MEASTVVIKVKYGDMLRRFNASVFDEELDLSMGGLIEKILSLFNFAPDTEIMLTYIDEDGDTVALVDDDDLRDVVKQALNPLRITIKLNTEKNDTPFARSTGTSTPLRSPQVQQPFQNPNAGVSEILKTIPEPLRETLVKLSTDLASKVSSSAPGIGPGATELVNYFSKVGLSYLDQLSESQTRVQPSSQSDDPENSAAAAETKNLNFSKVDTTMLKVPSNGRSEKQSSENNEIPPKLKPEATMKNIDVPSVTNNVPTEKEVNKPSELHVGPNPAIVGAPDPMKGDFPDRRTISVFPRGLGIFSDTLFVPSPGSFSNFPDSLSGPSLTYEYPFSGIHVENISAAPPQPASRAASFRRSRSQNDGSGTIFHRGVRCDGCRVHPISGPRFKSKVKVNYDLCSICFAAMGNDNDYIRMDHPAVNRHHGSFKGLHDHHARGRCPALPQVYRGFKVKHGSSKLDSRFIQDVNIMDGTIIAPLTPFTKIWRMRNNGTVVWHQKTQLVWIGGDKLSNEFSVEVEIPAAGLAVGQELDVAVDFTSPELPGRYISYWRMASPSGQKFGQHVWVLIQVDATFKEMPRVGVRGLNLNLPPVNSVLTRPEIINEDLEPLVEDSQPEPENSKKTVEIVEPVVQMLLPSNEHEMKFPITDSLLVGSGASSSAPAAPSSVSYPIVDLSDMAAPAFSRPPPPVLYPPPPPVFYSAPPPVLYPSPPPSVLYPSPTPVGNTQAYAEELLGKEEVEEKLLRELEEMGFKQVDLNKEILRMHEYDLEQAVDDLCGVAEWDPILEELQEMGFHDTEMNKILLKKNNGSIKRVVMDLISGEEM